MAFFSAFFNSAGLSSTLTVALFVMFLALRWWSGSGTTVLRAESKNVSADDKKQK